LELCWRRYRGEEAGITPKITENLGVKEKDGYTLYFFLGTCESCDVTLNYESSEYKWVDAENYDSLNYVPFVKGVIESTF
jgi:hypothetical protein